MAAALRHPNIVEILAILGEGPDVYIVSEFVPGKSVRAVIAEHGPLGFSEARAVLRRVAHALDYAHARGMFHGDLDAASVLIGEDGGVKVMDFSLALLAKEAASGGATPEALSPGMAPEQRHGVMVRQADVYALAVCFYEMLCGRLPFAGRGTRRLERKLAGRHVPISRRVQGLPAALDEIFAKALDPEPDNRYPSAGKFLAAVELAELD